MLNAVFRTRIRCAKKKNNSERQMFPTKAIIRQPDSKHDHVST